MTSRHRYHRECSLLDRRKATRELCHLCMSTSYPVIHESDECSGLISTVPDLPAEQLLWTDRHILLSSSHQVRHLSARGFSDPVGRSNSEPFCVSCSCPCRATASAACRQGPARVLRSYDLPCSFARTRV